MRYKNIIPNLVSFEAALNKLRGFSFVESFSDYAPVRSKDAFHYSIALDEDIAIPSKYSFRSGYYFYSEGKWYYERKLFGKLTLKFAYDPCQRTFGFNRLYSWVPFEIGGILPVGRHINDFIELELFLNGYVIFRGCAFSINDKNICIVAPGLNGKTSLVKDLLKKGARYIAEDLVTINFDSRLIYPSGCHRFNYGRKTNRDLGLLLETADAVGGSVRLDKLFFAQNHTGSSPGRLKTIDDYLMLCSLFFMHNAFVRAYMAESGLLPEIKRRLSEIRIQSDIGSYLSVKDYSFNKLLNENMANDANKEHWDELGKSYADVWQNPARQRMHQAEMEFINRFVRRFINLRALDIGVGTGRIISNYLSNPEVKEIFGVDISDSMIKLCSSKFENNDRVRQLEVVDLSKEEVPFGEVKFGIISAIRVLKYNKNWPEMIGKIAQRLDVKGIAIITMPNSRSINRFGHYSIPYYRTTRKELREVCRQHGLRVLDMRSFTRVPDALYDYSDNPVYIRGIIILEKLLGWIFGKTFLGRMFFVAAQKLQ